MQKAKEYKILPQIEEDNFYIHDRRKQGWLYCFVGLLVVLLLMGIGATVVVLCGWTDDLYKVLRQSLQGAENITGSLGGHFERLNNGSGVTLGPTYNNSSEEYYYTSSGEMSNSTLATTSAEIDTNGTVTQAPPNGIDEYNAGVKFAEMMRRFEKILEKFSVRMSTLFIHFWNFTAILMETFIY